MLQKIIYSILLFTLAFVIPAFPNHSVDTVKTKNGIKEEWIIKDKFGNTQEIIRLKSGLKDGIQETYYSNGKKSEEVNYANGNISGLKITYDINGDLSSKTNYKYYPEKKRSMTNGDFEIYSRKILISKGTYKDSLLSGLIEEYHSDGKKKSASNYLNGLKSGESITYNFRGEIAHILNYQIISDNGKQKSVPHGNHRYYDTNGKLQEEGNYINGLKEGIWNSYQNGLPYKSVTWKNNRQHGEIIEYQNGKLRKKFTFYEEFDYDGKILKNIYQGKLEEYHVNETLAKIEFYKNGKKNGIFEEYFDNGKLKSRNEYIDNLQNGKSEYWDDKGNKTVESEFKIIFSDLVETSVRIGKFLRWENGVLASESQYENGEEMGERKIYHKNGKLMTVSYVMDGHYNGKVSEYYDNGILKSEQTYKRIIEKNGNPKGFQVGWRSEYERNGDYTNRYYYDSTGVMIISMNYFKGKPMLISYKDICTMEFFPDGKLLSFQLLGPIYGSVYSHYFYWNGKTRKLKVQNANNSAINYIDFSDKGEPQFSYSDHHQNPVDKRMDENDMKKYAKTIHSDLTSNPFFNDTIRNGKYQLFYSGGKLMAEFNFKDDFPEGKFLFFDPIGNDTLYYAEYSKGNRVGYNVQKFGGKTIYHRGNKYENGQIAWIENYHPNGLPTSKMTYDAVGNRILNLEYYENGKIKYDRNELTREYSNYDKDGLLYSETVIIDPIRNIRRYSEFFPRTKKLKSKNFTRNNERDSIHETYFENGNLQTRFNYKKGKRNGLSESYDEKGQMISKGNYSEDKQDGLFLQWNKDKMDTLFYVNGNLTVNPSSIACACQDTKESTSTTTFAPPVDQLLPFSRLMEYLPGNIVPEDSLSFSKIYYTSMQTSSSRDGAFYSMNLMMFQPHFFHIPSDKQIKLTINPCHTKGYRSRLETRVNVNFKDENESDASFYPERISLEFVKSPMKSDDKNIANFTTYYDMAELKIDRNKSLIVKTEEANKGCHTLGVVYKFLKIMITESRPALFDDPKNIIDDDYTKLNLSDSEWNKFFGIYSNNANCIFPLISGTKEYQIKAFSNLMLIGGTYVSGELRVTCTKSGDDLELNTEQGKIKITLSDIKSQWLKKGFTKLSADYEKESGELIIRFFAD